MNRAVSLIAVCPVFDRRPEFFFVSRYLMGGEASRSYFHGATEHSYLLTFDGGNWYYHGGN